MKSWHTLQILVEDASVRGTPAAQQHHAELIGAKIKGIMADELNRNWNMFASVVCLSSKPDEVHPLRDALTALDEAK